MSSQVDKRANPASRRARGPYWLRLVYVGYWAFAGWTIAHALRQSTDIKPQLILFESLLLLLGVNILLIALHECGHAAAALVLRWRVSLVSVGPFAVRLSPLKIMTRFPASWFQGATYTVPTDTTDLRLKWIAVMAAGVGVNMVVGLAVLGWTHFFGNDSAFDEIVTALAGLSIVMGLVNLVPFTTQWQRSDGGRIYDAIVGRNLRPFIRLSLVGDAVIHCLRPRDWKPELINALQADAAEPCAEGTESWYLYYYYFDIGDMTGARAALKQAQQRLGQVDYLKIEDAFLCAYADSDYLQARSTLNEVSSRLRRWPQYMKAEAVLLLGEGKVSAAKKAIARARRALKKSPFTTRSAYEFLDELERKANALQASSTTPVIAA